jgi:hypothetical protein
MMNDELREKILEQARKAYQAELDRIWRADQQWVIDTFHFSLEQFHQSGLVVELHSGGSVGVNRHLLIQLAEDESAILLRLEDLGELLADGHEPMVVMENVG